MRQLILGAASGTFAASAVTGFLVLDLVRNGFSEPHAGMILAVAGGLAVATRLGGGVLIDHRPFASERGMLLLLASGCLGYLLLSSQWVPAIVVGGFAAYGAGDGWQTLYHYTLIELFPHNVGAATGAARLGLATGAALGPSFFGFLVSRTSYPVGWITTAVLMALAAVLVKRGCSNLRSESPETLGVPNETR